MAINSECESESDASDGSTSFESYESSESAQIITDAMDAPSMEPTGSNARLLREFVCSLLFHYGKM